MSGWVDRLWYGRGRPLWWLWPLAWLYRAVAERRRYNALQRLNPHDRPAVPVIVVGNITAGGTGKSPLTAWLVEVLREAGWRPVILTRGYGGRAGHYPLQVSDQTSVTEAGDEPVMLARQASCPVVVDPRRARGAAWAIQQGLGNLLICDDGLQHYALHRDLELVVFDGQRGIGNGAPIPVGPLREPVERIATVDFVIVNGEPERPIPATECRTMTLRPERLVNLHSGQLRPLSWLAGQRVRGVAGIGNPSRFFRTLTALGAQVTPVPLADHHRFTADDLAVDAGEILVMTAKDAVKCDRFAHEHCWVLEVKAQLPESFRDALVARVNALGLASDGPAQSAL